MATPKKINIATGEIDVVLSEEGKKFFKQLSDLEKFAKLKLKEIEKESGKISLAPDSKKAKQELDKLNDKIDKVINNYQSKLKKMKPPFSDPIFKNSLENFKKFFDDLGKEKKGNLGGVFASRKAELDQQKKELDDLRKLGELTLTQNENFNKRYDKQQKQKADIAKKTQQDIERNQKAGEAAMRQQEEQEFRWQEQQNKKREAEKRRHAKELEKQEKARLAQAKRDAAEAKKIENERMGFLKRIGTNILSGVGSILTAFGITASIHNLVNGLKEVTDASIDFAQAQYNLGVQVEAAQRSLGTAAAGTLPEWQERIQTLRKELGLFSTTDITKAVAQTSVFTRVLGLNADEQEQVIRLASTLAQTTGVDLSQAIDDVTKALGGSSVVLDKYGLFIRDADKGSAAFQLGFTDRVLKGTQTLNSQQLALATLKTIMDQVNPLYASLGDYQETLPGQLKKVNSEIKDQNVLIGENLSQITLLGENLKLVFLKAIEDIVGNNSFKEFNDFLKGLNDLFEQGRDIESVLGEAPEMSDYGVDIGNWWEGDLYGLGFYKKLSELQNLGVSREEGFARGLFEPELFVGDPQKIRKFLIDSQNYYLDYFQELKKMKAEAFTTASANKEEAESEGFKPNILGDDTPLPDSEMVDEYGEKIIDAYNKWQEEDTKNNDDYNNKKQKLEDEREKDLAEHAKDLERETEDLERDLARDREDALRDYNRSLEDLSTEENTKKLEIEQDFQEQMIDATDDYYDALRDLENQYYFDLRDAVAENDAVAIKKLERKFNFDKSKLEENLTEQEDQETRNYEARLEELTQDTENRRVELQRRYDQELEDINVAEDRKREDIKISHEREMGDLEDHYQEQFDLLETEYDLQTQAIQDAYDDRLLEIGAAFLAEENVTAAHLEALLQMYDHYIGSDGLMTQMVSNFFNRQNQLSGISLAEYQSHPGSMDDLFSSSGGGLPPVSDIEGNTMRIIVEPSEEFDVYILDGVGGAMRNVMIAR